MMRFIFTILLIVFSLVSAYITFLFTSSLASTGAASIVAFAALGFAFDFLKCSLPSVILDCISAKKWGFAFISSMVSGLLIAFSLYASFALFDNTAQTKIKSDNIYQMTLEQNKRATAEYNRLIEKNYRTVANRDYLPIIERTTAELKQLQAPQTIGSKIALMMNIALAILLEFSVFACHIALKICGDKRYKKGGRGSKDYSTSTQLERGTSPATRSAKNSTDSTIKTLPLNELAALLIARGDSKMTYKQLENKYQLTAPKISEIKQYIKHNKPHLTAV